MTIPSDVTLIPNLLGANAWDYAQTRFTDPAIHWYYLPITAGYDDMDNLSAYRGSFSHTIWGPSNSAPAGAMSPMWDPALLILLAALDRSGERLESVLRVRLGMCTRTPEPIVHSPHIDQGVEHRTGIFYPLDSDGDTVLYSERAEYGSPDRPESYTREWSHKPTANTWFSFDGARYHSSTSPAAHDTRLVLTYNYTVLKS
jgi:hypothetical protein